MRRLLPLLALTPLAACAVGPNYRHPPIAPTAQLPFAGGTPAASVVTPLPLGWWHLYRDAALDELVARALVANADLRVAAANLARAQAELREARSERLPTTQITGGATYGRGSVVIPGAGRAGAMSGTGTGTGGTGAGTGTSTGNGGSTTGGGTGTGGAGSSSGSNQSAGESGSSKGVIYSAGFGVAYEIDLFGRITRAIQAARADAEATQATADAVRVTVAADTTQAYLQACTLQEQIDVALSSLKLVAQSYEITKRQVRLGAASDYDLSRIGVLVEQTRSAVAPLVAQRQYALFGLATLTGRPPAEIPPAALACKKAPRIDRQLPVGDGAALLRRRPDIREAERTLAADVARIGVATADLYPSITLGGAVDSEGRGLHSATSRSGLSFGVGPLISWFFPNISAARARVAQSRAEAAASLARFDGAVLTGLRETDQALATYAGEIERNAALAAAVRNSKRAFDLSNAQLQFGSISQLEQIDVQRDLVSTQSSLAQSNAALADDQVAVFRALGGGWEDAPPVPLVPATGAPGR